MAWETCNDVWGMRVTGKGAYASKSIFLPAAGYGEDFDLYDLGSYGSYWSSSCSDLNAWGMDFDSSDFYWSEVDRSYGQSVRPVRGYATFGLAFSAATTHLALDTRTEPGGEEPGGEVTATAMTAQQRYPWNGLVDITVTLSGASNDAAHVLCTFVATNSATHAALNVSHVSGDTVVSGSGGTWMRRFVWDATADIGEVKIADLELAVEAKPNPLGGVQLWEGGPHWAECNVGASNPEEYGYYFWWGGTVGYGANTNGATWTDGGYADGDYWDDVEWASSEGDERSSSPFALPNDASRLAKILRSRPFRKTISELQSAGYIDSTGNLVAAYDAATAHLGTPWRMPTAADFAELISKCDTTWETCNGVWGRRVTGRGTYASRSIFLPAAGYDDGPFLCYLGLSGCYWSSTPDSNNENYAWDLELDSSAFCRGYIDRNFGQSVRPVRGFAMFGVAFSAATTHVALDTRIGTRCAQAEEPIAFGADWNVGVTQLVLTVDGVNVLTTTSPTNGVYIWKPDLSTSRTVTLEHTTYGTVNETLTAAFDVTGGGETGGGEAGGEVTATAMTAQQRYPWNGLVDITVTLSGTSNDAAQVAITFVATNSATHVALDVLHVTGGSVVSGSGSTWTRQFVWDATADIGEVKIADVELAVEAKPNPLGGVQLWEDGPYWAKCNVGATKPEECGYYFWWGDTIGYSANTNGATWKDDSDGGYWDGVTWVSSKGDIMSSSPFSSSTCQTYDKTIEQLQSEGYISRRLLLPAHDAATAHLGVPWRMPTENDVDELISKCYTTWETCNGVWGLRVTGKGAYLSKSIFLPAVGDCDGNRFYSLGSEGYYWVAEYSVGISNRARSMHISSDDFSEDSYNRRFGRSVRPVRGSATLGLAFSEATTHLALDTRTGTRCVQPEEPIAFSTDWNEGVTQLVLTVDGVNVLATTSPTNGVYVWKPDPSTTRVVMLELTTCGTVNETLTATFTPCVYVDAAKGSDARDGSSAGQAVKTLARAYALAEAGNVIMVAAGTYGPVTATGKAVTFRGADGATIDGAGVSRCVTADVDVVFENFILQNGRDAASGGGVYGGTFERCTIRDCHSDQNGGGAYEATLRHCAIIGNTAENGCGGGAYGGILVGCVVKDNVAGEAGGGVFAPESLSDTIFSGNSPEDSPDVGGTVKAGGMHVYVPSGAETGHVIPHDWFLSSGLANAGDSTTGLNARLATVCANGYTGWESYVAGLSPNDATSQFRAVITITEGKVCVSWTPNLNSNGVTRIYTPFGRTDLETDDWGTPVRPWHQFFKVEVAMPTGARDEKSAVAGEGFVPEALGGVQLWENGPYWAECNVGATKPEEYGYYFWWGDTVGYSAKTNNATWVDARSWNYWGNVTWVSNKGAVMSSSPFSSSTCPTHKKTTAQLQSEGYIDSTGNLVAAHDAATAHLGAPWRMPTYSDFKDLVDKCDTIWETCNGVWGRRVTGRGAYSSKSIFLPAAGECEGFSITNLGSGGYYWSSMLDSYISYAAFGLWFYSDDFTVCYSSPSSGWSVRPVRDSAQ